MTKRILEGVLALVLALGMTPIPANFVQNTTITASAGGNPDAEKEYMDGDFSFIIKDDGTAAITGYYGEKHTIIQIPDKVTASTQVGVYPVEHKDCLVTSIGTGDCSSIFSYHDPIEIIIPDSVTIIEDCSFAFCNSLKSVKFGKNVKTIGSSAFASCKSLTELIIPETVTDIGELAFSGMTSLKSIKIPDGVKKLETSVFRECSGLTSVTLGKGLTEIGDYTFADCSNLTSINIPDNVTSIGNYTITFLREEIKSKQTENNRQTRKMFLKK